MRARAPLGIKGGLGNQKAPFGAFFLEKFADSVDFGF